LRKLESNVKEAPLAVPCRTASLEDAIHVGTNVIDGFLEMQQRAAACNDNLPHAKAKALPSSPENIESVHEAKMLSGAAVRNISMPGVQRLAVREWKLLLFPNTRTVTLNFPGAAVRSLESFRSQAAEIRDGSRFLMTAPAVCATEQITRLPHRRRSVDVETMKESERISFLNEAAKIKDIPADRAELLAVFRHVPIEMISRLRFLASRKEILYSIPSGLKRTRIRVHDMAAIRDNANLDVHLVPHRTQSKQVVLTNISTQRGI
jgi:hypothetical protein